MKNKLIDGAEIRKCKRCSKTYILRKGFYKAKTGYRHVCKKCIIEEVKKHKANNRERHEYHKFKPHEGQIEICERCGLIKRKKAGIKPGMWINEYKVKGKWQTERPSCLSYIDIKT